MTPFVDRHKNHVHRQEEACTACFLIEKREVKEPGDNRYRRTNGLPFLIQAVKEWQPFDPSLRQAHWVNSKISGRAFFAE